MELVPLDKFPGVGLLGQSDRTSIGSCYILQEMQFKNTIDGDFSGGPVGKTPHSQCTGPGFDPWSGNWIPHACRN